MIRKIIKIDEDKCDGCGLCADACHEAAIQIVDGKAKLMRDDYCDGLGNCLPVCPTGAITFEEREAKAYDEAAVEKHIADIESHSHAAGGCPGSKMQVFDRETNTADAPMASNHANTSASAVHAPDTVSELRQWPIQIKLAPVNAPYFDGAKLLIAADCAAYARASFHSEFMRDKITLIGCPKLDETDYSDKLTEILKENNIKSVTAVRMEVPCCGGIEQAVGTAIMRSKKPIPWQVITFSINGELLDS
jgi:ferredoxin